jgi:hypothetical protein
MDERPWFMWDVKVTELGLRERLRHADPRIRAQWAGRIMREATYPDVWRYLSLEEILRDWEHIEKHLGRRRAFWQWLLQGWREDGLLSA